MPSDIIATDLGSIRGPRTDRSLFDLAIRQASQGEIGHVVVWLQRRDGTPFLASIHTFPVYCSDEFDETTGRCSPPMSTAASGGRKLMSSFFTRCANTDNGNTTKTRRSPSPVMSPITVNGSIRDSDVDAFRPSYLRSQNDADRSINSALDTSHLPSSPQRPEQVAEPLLLVNEALSPSDTSGDFTVKGFVSLTPAAKVADSRDKRWKPFDSKIYCGSPILFIVMNFNVIQENLG